MTGTGVTVDIDIPSGSSAFYFCDQDMVRLKFPHNFPAIPSNQPAGYEWMIPDQNFAYVYGYTCIGILGFVLLILLNKLRKFIMAFFLSPFEVRLFKSGCIVNIGLLPFLPWTDTINCLSRAVALVEAPQIDFFIQVQ